MQSMNDSIRRLQTLSGLSLIALKLHAFSQINWLIVPLLLLDAQSDLLSTDPWTTHQDLLSSKETCSFLSHSSQMSMPCSKDDSSKLINPFFDRTDVDFTRIINQEIKLLLSTKTSSASSLQSPVSPSRSQKSTPTAQLWSNAVLMSSKESTLDASSLATLREVRRLSFRDETQSACSHLTDSTKTSCQLTRLSKSWLKKKKLSTVLSRCNSMHFPQLRTIYMNLAPILPFFITGEQGDANLAVQSHRKGFSFRSPSVTSFPTQNYGNFDSTILCPTWDSRKKFQTHTRPPSQFSD